MNLGNAGNGFCYGSILGVDIELYGAKMAVLGSTSCCPFRLPSAPFPLRLTRLSSLLRSRLPQVLVLCLRLVRLELQQQADHYLLRRQSGCRFRRDHYRRSYHDHGYYCCGDVDCVRQADVLPRASVNVGTTGGTPLLSHRPILSISLLFSPPFRFPASQTSRTSQILPAPSQISHPRNSRLVVICFLFPSPPHFFLVVLLPLQ